MTLLENVSTLDTVRDLDRIRAALGQAKLNYLGFSYGTYLGEVYAQTYPGHVRAMVLDGVFNPALSNNEILEQQAEGFEADLADFFAWCPRDKACSRELPQGAKTAYKLLLGASGRRSCAHRRSATTVRGCTASDPRRSRHGCVGLALF